MVDSDKTLLLGHGLERSHSALDRGRGSGFLWSLLLNKSPPPA